MKNTSGVFLLFTKQKMTEVTAKNNMLEASLEEANKLLKFYMNKEESRVDGKFFHQLFYRCFNVASWNIPVHSVGCVLPPAGNVVDL